MIRDDDSTECNEAPLVGNKHAPLACPQRGFFSKKRSFSNSKIPMSEVLQNAL
jgi:hypothetical protein